MWRRLRTRTLWVPSWFQSESFILLLFVSFSAASSKRRLWFQSVQFLFWFCRPTKICTSSTSGREGSTGSPRRRPPPRRSPSWSSWTGRFQSRQHGTVQNFTDPFTEPGCSVFQAHGSGQRLLRQHLGEVGPDELCSDLRVAGRGSGECFPAESTRAR